MKPCACKGSIEYVHLGCLRQWIKGRLHHSDETNGSYFYRNLPCELCKTPYPAYCHSGEEKKPLAEVPWTQPPFIVLENMMRDSQQPSSRGLHIVSLADAKQLTMGRGHDSDVCIKDVSTSRCHATIRFDPESSSFILEDHNSKFGTLVAMKKPHVLEPGSAISVQVGRTVLSLSLPRHSEPDQLSSDSPQEWSPSHRSSPGHREDSPQEWSPGHRSSPGSREERRACY